ncbi:MAG: hypothetical protein KDA32_00870 [Phycisphaerales bacterium]|nr:hypothetical protein [Phycisphaerales bacterium]
MLTWSRTPFRRASRHPFARAVAALVAVGFLTGCENLGKIDLNAAVQNLIQPDRTPQQYLLVAVSDTDPDIRRDAIAEVAESDQRDKDWAIKGMSTVALLETDTHARCVAIRGLGASGRPEAVDVALKILNAKSYAASEVWPPEPLCRADAAKVLADAVDRGAVREEQSRDARATLLQSLQDEDPEVRVFCAKGLRRFADAEVVDALIAATGDSVFAVAYEADYSLAVLTGHTFDCRRHAWEAWRAANGDRLFADGGKMPPKLQPPYSGAWGKIAYDTKKVFQTIIPAAKD